MDPTEKTALTRAFDGMHTALVNLDVALQKMGDEELLRQFHDKAEYEMVLFMRKVRLELDVPYKVTDAG